MKQTNIAITSLHPFAGNPYQVRIDAILDTTVADTLEGAVSFPNYMRHYYEEGVYDSGADWEWDRYH